MSKMPSKKKSCFQITSVVTQSQVAANNNTEDTESLDDPDDSTRTEDVSSSEIYDMSKGGDFEPEACDVSLTDEPLHSEAETSGQDSSRNASAVQMNPSARAAGQMSPASVSAQTSTPNTAHTTSVSSSATVSTCSSRFRVIKLDHGTGEPFKRGRWTCTEFYERDTDAGRTVENVKHTDHSVDKDGAAAHVSTLAADPHTDSGYISAPSNPPVELQQHPFGIAPQNPFGDAKSPSMPSTTQPQPFYAGKPLQKPVQVLQTLVTDYRAQHQPPGSPVVSVATLPLVTPLTQGPSPIMTPAAGGVHLLGMGLPISQPEHAVQPGMGMVAQALAPLIQPAVTVSVSSHAGVQNVPVVMSSASNTPQSVPKQNAAPQQNQPQGVPSGSVVGLGAQMSLSGFGPIDEGLRKPEMLQQSSGLSIRPLNPEGLQLHTPAVNSLFGIALPIDGDEDSASGASVVAIDNKIEQAMDLVKSHLMYAVREEVEVLKEQIKELYERNSVLERENAVLKSLANNEQLTQLTTQIHNPSSTSPQQTTVNAILQEASKLVALPTQPNVSTA